MKEWSPRARGCSLEYVSNDIQSAIDAKKFEDHHKPVDRRGKTSVIVPGRLSAVCSAIERLAFACGRCTAFRVIEIKGDCEALLVVARPDLSWNCRWFEKYGKSRWSTGDEAGWLRSCGMVCLRAVYGCQWLYESVLIAMVSNKLMMQERHGLVMTFCLANSFQLICSRGRLFHIKEHTSLF